MDLGDDITGTVGRIVVALAVGVWRGISDLRTKRKEDAKSEPESAPRAALPPVAPKSEGDYDDLAREMYDELSRRIHALETHCGELRRSKERMDEAIMEMRETTSIRFDKLTRQIDQMTEEQRETRSAVSGIRGEIETISDMISKMFAAVTGNKRTYGRQS